MSAALMDRGADARGWFAERREDLQAWWDDKSPRSKRLIAACAALGVVCFIGVVAGAASSGGSGSGDSGGSDSQGAGEFERGTTDEPEKLPPPEDCVLPGPYCEFEDSEQLEVCLDGIDNLGYSGCAFEGLCVVREECVCYDLPDTPEQTCGSFSGPAADCNRFGACEFDFDASACVPTEDCEDETVAPSASPTSAPVASPATDPPGNASPSASPSVAPSVWPSYWPTYAPSTSAPTARPSVSPTVDSDRTEGPTPRKPGWTPPANDTGTDNRRLRRL